MNPDLSVRIEHTAQMYRDMHNDWEARVREYARQLEGHGCDLLLSNVSYLSLAAARYLGVPALALCSLNWADVYRYYCHRVQGFERIHRQMVEAYASAELFLTPEPSMPMNPLFNTHCIGPVAATGLDRKSEIHARLGADPSCKLILVAMGGHDMQLSVDWPDRSDLVWLVPGSWQVSQARTVAMETLDMPFLDLLASCDLLIGKPGYGSFTEAACAGTPVLYVLRPDWPEERYLVEWLHKYGRCRQLAPGQLPGGGFVEDALALMDAPPPEDRPYPVGIEEIAQTIRRILER